MHVSENSRERLFIFVAALLPFATFADTPCPPTNVHIEGNITSGTDDLICPVVSPASTYTTNFDNAENPISEGGAWTHKGLDWKSVVTENGIAHGTQTGTDGYDDSYAILSGFSADQAAWGVAHIDAGIDKTCSSQELEILIRWSDSAGSAQGYECMIHHDGGYAQIVRWNGPLGDFNVLGGGSAPGFKNGDTVKATAVGSVITLFHNDVPIVQVSDDTFSTGNPGVGFFKRSCGRNSDYGFTNFTATDEL
jgi:hypothetical protein